MDAALSEGEVAITIADRGSWRPPVDNDRGRGLHLIRALTDGMELIPGENGTTVRMHRRLTALDAGKQEPAQPAAVRSSFDSS